MANLYNFRSLEMRDEKYSFINQIYPFYFEILNDLNYMFKLKNASGLEYSVNEFNQNSIAILFTQKV